MVQIQISQLETKLLETNHGVDSLNLKKSNLEQKLENLKAEKRTNVIHKHCTVLQKLLEEHNGEFEECNYEDLKRSLNILSNKKKSQELVSLVDKEKVKRSLFNVSSRNLSSSNKSASCVLDDPDERSYYQQTINIANLVETDQNSASLMHGNYSAADLISFEMDVDEANQAQSSGGAFPVNTAQSPQDSPVAAKSPQDSPVAAQSQQDSPVATQSPQEDIPVAPPHSEEGPTKEKLSTDCGVINLSPGTLSDKLGQIIPVS